ncbi:5065_t:CDS:2, partial [Funneliformis caledonium]
KPSSKYSQPDTSQNNPPSSTSSQLNRSRYNTTNVLALIGQIPSTPPRSKAQTSSTTSQLNTLKKFTTLSTTQLRPQLTASRFATTLLTPPHLIIRNNIPTVSSQTSNQTSSQISSEKFSQSFSQTPSQSSS